MNLNEYVNEIKQANADEANSNSEEQIEKVDEVLDESVSEEIDTEQPEEIIEEDVEELDTADEEESEESGEEENDTDENELTDEELEYYQIGDIEATLEEVKEWKEGSLRQADYTKKTQELSDRKKAFESVEVETNNIKADLIDKAANLEVLIKETDEEHDMEDLKEYDPAEYLRIKELQDKRKAAVKEVKDSYVQTNNQSNFTQEQLQAESQKVFADNPTWLDDKGQQTEACKNDLKLANDYLDKIGMPNEERSSIVSSLHWKLVMDAAKSTQVASKAEVIKKKVRKAPTVVKSSKGKTALSVGQKEIKDAEQQLAKTHSLADYTKLEKVKAKYNKS
jgi:hypothetical protein